MTRTSRAAGLGGQLRVLSFSAAHNGIGPADHPVGLFRAAFGALDLYFVIGFADELLKKLPTSGTAEFKNRHCPYSPLSSDAIDCIQDSPLILY